MSRKRFVLGILAALGATCGFAAAPGPTNEPMFQQWILRQTRFTFVGGRIVSENAAGLFFGQSRNVYEDGPVREQVEYNGNGAVRSIEYLYQRRGDGAGQKAGPKVEFAIQSTPEGRFVLRYSDKDHPSQDFSFTQVPGQPVCLSLPRSNKPRVLRAPSVWHLLVIDQDECRAQFLPMLESIRQGWRVGAATQSIEDELVKMAAVSRKSDRKQWEVWVHELGDPIWGRRNRADENLREVGPAVLGYLNRLDFSKLDAEQKSRIRGILRGLSVQTGEDTPQRVASTLVEDPLVWLALLARPEESTRQAAAQQLAVLLGTPIGVDPKAEPATQGQARDALRVRIERTSGGGSREPEKNAVPAGGNHEIASPPPKP